jgi:YHS domain-containing protein
MFMDVNLPVHLPAAITVPVDALLNSGLKNTVFVDRGQGYFEPRQVETGWRLGDRVEVTQGLSPGEKIVVSGNFLIDSESRMKLAAAGMLGEVNQDPVCGRNLDETKARAAGHFKEIDGKTYYFCSPKCQQQFEMVPERYASREDQASEPQIAKQESEVSGVKGEAQPSQTPSCCPAATKARDPVCGMEIEAAKAKESGHQSDFSDKNVLFLPRLLQGSI